MDYYKFIIGITSIVPLKVFSAGPDKIMFVNFLVNISKDTIKTPPFAYNVTVVLFMKLYLNNTIAAATAPVPQASVLTSYAPIN